MRDRREGAGPSNDGQPLVEPLRALADQFKLAEVLYRYLSNRLSASLRGKDSTRWTKQPNGGLAPRSRTWIGSTLGSATTKPTYSLVPTRSTGRQRAMALTAPSVFASV